MPLPPLSLSVRELAEPCSVLGLFEQVLHLPYPLLLDSTSAEQGTPAGQAASDEARYTFITADPRIVIRAKAGIAEAKDREGRTIVRTEGRALDLARELGRIPRAGLSSAEIPLPFQGGVAGYIGYEYGATLERLPAPRADDLALPDVCLGIYDWVIAWDHAEQHTWVVGDVPVHAQVAIERTQAKAYLTTPATYVAPASVTSTFTRDQYATAIERIREYIRAGDIFQANLSQRLTVPWHASAWTLYQCLRAINPAPFAAYFDIGDATIVSASPERFLHVDPHGRVETRPIKGTRPRGQSATEDAQQRRDLLRSEKDAAEHVMIVDVLRNDLSRVCEYGSVQVPTLMAHEQYATVHHLVSTITGQLRPDTDAIDLMHACFPGGSITGAPKIRAMEIITELEPVARSVYCGAIGYWSHTGAMDTSIAIRTAIVKNGAAYVGVGGGIVADSDPIAEYEETWHKAKALLQALGADLGANACPP